MLIGKVNITPNDLLSLGSQLHHNLLSLNHFQGDLSELGLYLIATNESLEDVELKPGGKDVQLILESVTEYIHIVADYLLNTWIANQVKAFKDAFLEVMDPQHIVVFNEEELEILITGSTGNIDICNLQANTKFIGYEEYDPLIHIFWQVVTEIDYQHRKKLLKFVTRNPEDQFLASETSPPSFSITKQELKKLVSLAYHFNL